MQTALIFAAAVAAAAPEGAALPELEVVTRRAVTGDLTQGVQEYRSEFFTPVRPGTALDMIKWLPGFTLEDSREIRGLAGAAGNVLIDGKPPTSKNDSLASVLGRIPASQVERVDIIVGGAPGIDMQGRAVLANVVLRKSAATGSATATLQRYADGRLAPEVILTTSRKQADRVLEGSLTASRRVFQNTSLGQGDLVRTDALGRVLFSGEERARADGPFVTGTASYEFPWAKGRLRVNGSARYSEYNLDDVASLRGSTAPYAVTGRDHQKRGEIGLRYERAFGRTTLETQALQRLIDHGSTTDTNRPPVVSTFAQDDAQSESVVRGVLRFKRDQRLTLEGSAEAVRNGLDTHAALSLSGRPTPLPGADVHVVERRAEVGAAVIWKPAAAFGVTLATKVETSKVTAEGDVSVERALTYVKPKLLFSWTPDKKNQLRFRIEREVSQLSFYYLIASVDAGSGQVSSGFPELRPFRDWAYEATWERQFWTGASLVVSARYFTFTDVVEATIIPELGGVVAQGNVGVGSRTDFVSTLTLPLGPVGLRNVTFKATINYASIRVTDPTTLVKRPFSGISTTVGDLHLAHDLPRWRSNWGLDATYAGSYGVYRPFDSQTNGALARLAVFVEHRPQPNLTLRLEAGNLLTPRPRQVVSVYTGPRNVAPVLYRDERRLGDGAYLLFRVRKTLS